MSAACHDKGGVGARFLVSGPMNLRRTPTRKEPSPLVRPRRPHPRTRGGADRRVRQPRRARRPPRPLRRPLAHPDRGSARAALAALGRRCPRPGGQPLGNRGPDCEQWPRPSAWVNNGGQDPTPRSAAPPHGRAGPKGDHEGASQCRPHSAGLRGVRSPRRRRRARAVVPRRGVARERRPVRGRPQGTGRGRRALRLSGRVHRRVAAAQRARGVRRRPPRDRPRARDGVTRGRRRLARRARGPRVPPRSRRPGNRVLERPRRPRELSRLLRVNPRPAGKGMAVVGRSGTDDRPFAQGVTMGAKARRSKVDSNNEPAHRNGTANGDDQTESARAAARGVIDLHAARLSKTVKTAEPAVPTEWPIGKKAKKPKKADAKTTRKAEKAKRAKKAEAKTTNKAKEAKDANEAKKARKAEAKAASKAEAKARRKARAEADQRARKAEAKSRKKADTVRPHAPGARGTATAVGEPSARGTAGSNARSIAGYPPDDLRRDLLLARVSRAIDDREIALQKQSRVFFQISGAGHEALLLALARELRPGYDWFFPYYRDLALMLGLGMTAEQVLLQAVGSADDPASAGRQMPAHWGYKPFNVVTQSSPTGSQCIPAVGCAEAGRYIVRRPQLGLTAHGDEVTYVSLGEGATSEGEFWESLNTACTEHLPVLFLVADNGYAISVPSSEQSPAPVNELVRGFAGLQVRSVDGTDYFAVRRAARKIVANVRAGVGPALMHARVTRPYSHSAADTQSKYRLAQEMEWELEHDPIDRLEREPVDGGVVTDEEAAAIRAD